MKWSTVLLAEHLKRHGVGVLRRSLRTEWLNTPRSRQGQGEEIMQGAILKRFGTALTAVFAAILLPLSAGSTSAYAAGDDGMSFGAFARPLSGQSERQAVEQLESGIGRTLDTVRVFETWEQTFPDAFHTWLRDGDRTLLLSVKPVRANGSVITWNSLATAASGSQLDNEIRSWARRVRDFGAPIYVTLHHEPEASASVTFGDAAAYIAAWRHWVDVFRAEGAANAHFMWITTDYAHWLPGSDRRFAAKWYPGDAWVDGMGIDAYNWHVCRPNQDNVWKTLEQIIDPFRQFGASHPGKELWLTEWASWEDPNVGGRKAGWIDQARVLFDDPAWSQFVGIAYFNAQATNAAFSNCDWRVTTSASSLASFAAMALDPFWSREVFPDGPVAPTVDFVFSCTDLECTFDSQPTDPDGTIVSTEWDFGDGTTASGTATSHTFTAAGTYSVHVTVTDNDGLTGSRAREVTVAESGVSPITFVAQATGNANSTTHRVVVPATVASGDALIVAVGSSTSAVISSPTGVTGWTSHGSRASGGTLASIWTKVADATDAGKTITVTTSTLSKVNMVVAAYRGTSVTDPVQVVASAAEDTTRASHTTPAATATGAGPQAVWYWTHKDNDTTTMVPPAGVSARSNSSQTGSGRVTGLLADSNGPVPAGTVAGRTATAATASAKATMWTIVLNPS